MVERNSKDEVKPVSDQLTRFSVFWRTTLEGLANYVYSQIEPPSVMSDKEIDRLRRSRATIVGRMVADRLPAPATLSDFHRVVQTIWREKYPQGGTAPLKEILRHCNFRLLELKEYNEQIQLFDIEIKSPTTSQTVDSDSKTTQ